MKQFIANSILAIVLFASGVGAHKGYQHFHHPVKHTWECQLAWVSPSGTFWFARPNREVFEMYFDNPPEMFTRPGMTHITFRDIAYTDDNADMRHFIKATVK